MSHFLCASNFDMEASGLPSEGPGVDTGGLSLVQPVSQRRGWRVTEQRGRRPPERPWGAGRVAPEGLVHTDGTCVWRHSG